MIAYNWKYKSKYSFYDMTEDKEDLEEFLNPNKWENTFAVLNDNNDLVGFYSYYFKEKIIWIGFGLKPELTGKGLGKKFVQKGIDYGIKTYQYDKEYIMLAVAEFNKRAINLYKKLGFSTVEKYEQKTNGGLYNFLKMKKILNLDTR
ncbi:MAG: GNAT family N-acetyltransferase [Halanaerobiales bacterium]|nr:GNAT family N-acetyltransferase [Halanaerobiales bacterium]